MEQPNRPLQPTRRRITRGNLIALQANGLDSLGGGKMNKLVILLALVFAISLTACAQPTPTAVPPTPVPPTATRPPAPAPSATPAPQVVAPTPIATLPTLVVKALTEKKVTELPTGPLFWRIENFSTLAQAQAAAGPTGLAVESGGKVWLFSLGGAGGSSAGGTKVAEVGPIPQVVASQYLLRINEASGPPGSITSMHSHPGSEAFYVLAGEQTIRTPQGMIRVKSGQPETGPGGGTPLQVSSSGSTDLHALVMFVVDATKEFSSPAKFP